MKENSIEYCFKNSPLILTEGAIGQRIKREFGFAPDPDIIYAGMIYNDKSRDALANIYREYLQTAQEYNLPILLMTNTRRANRERVLHSVYRDKDIMTDYAVFLRGLARDYQCDAFVGGMLGCKGDAYSGDGMLSTAEAIEFHKWQLDLFSEAPVDFLFAGIMPAKDEAVGMAVGMERTGLPYIISFMVNKNGTLPDGCSIHEAIQSIDDEVKNKPLCYMSNCVHPDILREAICHDFNRTALVKERFCGLQANAACMNPDELDSSAELHTSAAEDLAHRFELLNRDFPLKIMGGCCGTDNTHIKAIAERFSTLRK